MSNDERHVLESLQDLGLLNDDQIQKIEEQLDGDAEETIYALAGNLCKKSEADILQIVAEQLGMDTISLRDIEIPSDVLKLISAEIAWRYHTIPISLDGTRLRVALGNPHNIDTLDTLRYMLNYDIECVVASPSEISSALKKYYPSSAPGVESMLEEITEGQVSLSEKDAQNIVTDELEVADSDSEEPIIKLVNLLIIEAFRKRASDIHLEPMEKKFRVRYRIDGVLQEVDGPPRRLHPSVISRIKIMSGMKIAEKRRCQDGRIRISVMGRELDLRVSDVPTNHGESIVMRILDKQNLLLGLPELGFLADDQQTFEDLIALPDGIVLVTGPTGSGKTTTLYACLNYINKPDRKIITVEDPVEYQLSGINQVHVKADVGLTFVAALRSILRQAPNVIMIGEIRDFETAEIAINAALTGHLVFSTLHTNDAPSGIPRIVDMGVKPFLVASSVQSLMAQRLVRKVCDNCRAPYQPSEAELRLMGPAARELAGTDLIQGKGCEMCDGTGYSGRLGIFEIFNMTDETRGLVTQGVSASELRVKARQLGMRTMREDGVRKIIGRQTTLEEVLRVTMGDES